MDINLGKGMDGAEAAEHILKIRSLPIVFLTSHSEQAVVDRIKTITRYGYVIKNSGEFVLLESISMALELFEANRKLLYDMNKIEQNEIELKNRELILSSITVFAEKIFKSGINDDNFNFILSELGKAFDVSRTYIFRKTEENDEMVLLKQGYEWCADGVFSASDVLEVDNFVIQKDSAFYRKVRKFIADGYMIGYASEMDNEYENYLMEVQKLRSYLFISVFVNNAWWGMIGFDECKYERNWHQYEIQALSTVSNIIGGAIQQHLTEKELADNRQLYFTLVNSSPDSVSVTDLQGNLIFSSKHAMELFGYETDENTDGMSVFSWVSPQYQEFAYSKFSEIIKTGKPDSSTFILKRKDDTEFYAEITASRYDDSCNNPLGLIIVTRDISEKLKLERQIAEDHIRRKILIDESGDGIVILDDKGKVFEANKKFAEMLGYTCEEIKATIVSDWDRYFSGEELKTLLELDLAGTFNCETVHTRKDGSNFDVEICINKASVNGKRLIFCVCRDITKRKAIQQIIKENEEKFSKIFHNSPVGISINRISDGMYIDGLKL
jgi:PAS domain S-box-containing protein